MKKLSLLVFVLVGLVYAQKSPSFDCRKATHQVEKMICNDEQLSTHDNNLNQIYKKLKLEIGYARVNVIMPLNKLKSEQRAWLKKRDRCGTVSCIKDMYKKRIDELTCYNMIIRHKWVKREFIKNYGVYITLDALKKELEYNFKKRPFACSPKQLISLLEDHALYYTHVPHRPGESNLSYTLDYSTIVIKPYLDSDKKASESLSVAVEVSLDAYEKEKNVTYLKKSLLLLKRAEYITPNEPYIYKLQSKTYLKLLRYSLLHSEHDCSYKTLPFLLKQAIKTYLLLSGEDRLTKEERLINRYDHLYAILSHQNKSILFTKNFPSKKRFVKIDFTQKIQIDIKEKQ